MTLLERRLDNVVLAAGMALSRNHARQLVNHGHFRVNGRRVDIASYQVRAGDEVTPSTAESTRKIVSEALEVNKSQTSPAWLHVTADTLTAKVVGLPRREDIPHPIQEQLIIELCSK
jgi:small subunit ribosomal protein S4